MNREEAIKILKEHHDHWMRLLKEGICTEEEGENTIEALEMALKALEQEAEKAIKMRDATSEEQKSVDDFIKSISKPTGVDFWDLEQEPCEDAINRQAVLDLISREETLTAFADYVGSGMSMNDFDALWDIVAKMPAVNPTKTGHWIEHPEIETSTPEYLMFYECSECGDKQCFCKSDIHKKHFCNNCGARMVESQESEVKE